MLQVHQRQILETLQETRLNLLLELLRFIIAPSSSFSIWTALFQGLVSFFISKRIKLIPSPFQLLQGKLIYYGKEQEV